jgi:hypothetical protein
VQGLYGEWELVKQGLGIGVMQESVDDAERAMTHLVHVPGRVINSYCSFDPQQRSTDFQ